MRSVEWLSQGGPPGTDANDEQDWGNIDSFVVENGGVSLFLSDEEPGRSD